MPRREDDDVARGPGASNARSLVLAGGFALAVLATLAVFLTDNPQYLRIAVVAVAWAFVLAALAAGRRGTDKVAAAARERELRRVYERELDREVAARREYELELENELRRETEDAVRHELDALRADIAALGGLREEVARVSELRGDLTALAGLRDEVARVSALRDDLASLTSLRQELGQLAELRADMGRLRAELTEQLSSEMLVERIVMRTQASRLPADQPRMDTAGRSLDSIANWTDEPPPRELTGGWPAIRLDEPRETQQFHQVGGDRHLPGAAPSTTDSSWAEPPAYDSSWTSSSWSSGSWTPSAAVTGTWSTPSLPPLSRPPVPPTAAFPGPGPIGPAPAGPPESEPRTGWSSGSAGFDLFGPATPQPAESHRSRHAADEPGDPPRTTMSPVSPPPVTPAPSPLEWLSARELLDAPVPPPPARETPAVPGIPGRPSPRPRPAGTRSLPEVPPRRRRTGDAGPEPGTGQHPPVPGGPAPVRAERPPLPAVPPASATPVTGPPTGSRLDQILAENGVSPSTGGRRRRRYREDDEPDDVLARVLRGH